MQVSDHCGHVHYAPIEFEQLFEPLIPEFFSPDVDCTVDIRIDSASVCRFIQSSFDSFPGKPRLLRCFTIIRKSVRNFVSKG